jgi:dTDP-4-amino-4,6-dideoxy-D-galactose acyltransferase
VESDPCRRLEWDSAFWGFGCAQVLGENLLQSQQAPIDAWCSKNGINFLQYLAPADNPTSVRAAEEGGFSLVDERITLTCSTAATPLLPATSGIELRDGRAQDVADLEAIARVSHVDSRYYNDQRFSREGCDTLYATWIRRSVEGVLADAVFVPVVDGRAAGYVTCKRDEQEANRGWIGLVGVGAEAQGRGLGGALVGRAIDWFRQQAVSEVLVVTQGRNEAAQRLYRRCGFLTHDARLWFHKWYRVPASGDGDQRSAEG